MKKLHIKYGIQSIIVYIQYYYLMFKKNDNDRYDPCI